MRLRVASSVLALLAALSVEPATASAKPLCFDTGPGYQSCVSNGDYGNPIYEGPKLPDGVIPWAPDDPPLYKPPPPVYAAPPTTTVDPNLLALRLQQEIQRAVDDPTKDTAAYGIRVGDVTVAAVGTTDNGLAYVGTAAMSAGDGPERNIPVRVVVNGPDFLWTIEPGALQPLLE